MPKAQQVLPSHQGSPPRSELGISHKCQINVQTEKAVPMSSTRERSASFVQRGEISLSRDSGDKRARLWCPSTKSEGRWKRGAGRVSRPKSLHEDEVPGVRAAEPSPRCRRPPALRRRDAVPDAVGARGGEPALGRGARAARSPASLEDAGSGAPLYSPRSSQRPRRGRPHRPAAMARRERSRRVRPRRAPREDCAARRPRNARGGAGRGGAGAARPRPLRLPAGASPHLPRRASHPGSEGSLKSLRNECSFQTGEGLLCCLAPHMARVAPPRTPFYPVLALGNQRGQRQPRVRLQDKPRWYDRQAGRH
jgi:hypothetical protein